MNVITYDVYKNTVKKHDGFNPVTSEKNYSKLQFRFRDDDAWKNCSIITASFWISIDNIVKSNVELLSDNLTATFDIPSEFSGVKGTIKVGLQGSYKKDNEDVTVATNIIALNRNDGVIVTEGTNAVLYEEIIALVNKFFNDDKKKIDAFISEVNHALSSKADKATTLTGYGITDGENIGNKVSAVDFRNLSATEYPNITALYNYHNSYVEPCYEDIDNLKENKADKATTLAGYGITNAYTKTEVDEALSTKLDNTAGSVTTDNIASKAITVDKLAEDVTNQFSELKDDLDYLDNSIYSGFIGIKDIEWEFATAVNSSGAYIANSKKFYNGRYTTPKLMRFRSQSLNVTVGKTFRFFIYEYLDDGTFNQSYSVGKINSTSNISGTVILKSDCMYRFSYIPPNNTVTVDMTTLLFKISTPNYIESLMIKSDSISFDENNKEYNNFADISGTLQRYIDTNSIIVIPSGKYFIGETITISKPIKIIGYGVELYSNPKELGYKAIFDVISSDVSFEGITFRSESKYNAYFASDKLDVGLSSNIICIYTTEVNNISIKNCNAYNCFSLIRNKVSNYDWNVYSSNITIDSCYCDYSACGISGAGYKNLKVVNTIIRNIDMGYLCHNIYISRYSDGIFIDNCRFFATSNIESSETVPLQGDIITFHPSDQLYNFYSIKNVKVSNCVFDGDNTISYGIDMGSVENATFSSNTFLKIKNAARCVYKCKNVLFFGCNFDLTETSGLFYFQQVSLVDSSYVWSYEDIRCQNCTFNLYSPGVYIIRHWHNMDFIGCYFNIKSKTIDNVVSIFISPIDATDNSIYGKRMLRLINCSVMYDTYSNVNLYNSNNTKAFNDIVVLDGLSVKKITGVGQTAVNLGNNDTVHCMGCTFVGWKNITNNTDKFIDYGNNVCSDIISTN